MLFTLFHSPCQCDLGSMLSLLTEEDDLLLLQDGVIAVLKESKFFYELNLCPANLWVLKEDLIARGLMPYISTKVQCINYRGFVQLTIKHQQQIIW